MKNVPVAFMLFLCSYCHAQVQVPNSDFENWYTTPFGNEMPMEAPWFNTDSLGGSVSTDTHLTIFKSEDAYSGTYAMELRSYDTADVRYSGDVYIGTCCNATGQVIGTHPYTDRPRFFGFYYKYLAEQDTALVWLRLTDTLDGQSVGGTGIVNLLPSPEYKKIVLPVSYSMAPGYMMLRFSSSKYTNVTDNTGESFLLIDSLFFTNDTANTTGISQKSYEHDIKVYPNPVSEQLYFSTPDPGMMEAAIYDVLGRKVQRDRIMPQHYSLPVQKLKSGTYYLVLTDQRGKRFYTVFTKQ